jgi:hypothetical protein
VIVAPGVHACITARMVARTRFELRRQNADAGPETIRALWDGGDDVRSR